MPSSLAGAALGLLLVVGAAGSARAGRVAVFRIDPLGVDPQIVARLEGLLRMELGRLVDAAMPSPRRLQALMARAPRLQNCTGEVACLVEVGRLLGVEQVISGNVGGLAERFVLNVKLVDVASQKEVRRIQEAMSGEPDQLIEAVRVAAYGLVAPEKLLGALTVLANVPGAQVHLDGRLLGVTPLSTQHGLKVGSATLRLSKDGYTDAIQTVQVRFQKTAQVVVTLEQPRLGPKRRSSRPRVRPVPWYTRWWFWTAVGVVAAGLGTGLGFAFSSSRAINCDAEPARCR
ncbi:MAG: PEGA domain-containing protein [Deltaproteobacteria bacterium]|nr:PEGA domain-containing protein [Deltaproteobacteria bacterium]